MKRSIILFAGLFLITLLIAACAGEVPPTATPLVVADSNTASDELLQADSSTDLETTEDDDLVLLPTPRDMDINCINCHSDAELLQQVAVVEEEVESLSEGSG